MKQGSYINKGTKLYGKNYVGKNTVLSHVLLGYGSYVNSGSDLTNTRIGKYTSVGPNVKSVIGRHPTKDIAALHPAFYSDKARMGFTYISSGEFKESIFIDKNAGIQIDIGNDVWIGYGAMIFEGVTIGDGAVIGAGSLVNRPVEPYAVYAGVPAKKIGMRFEGEKREDLLRLKWWDRGESFITGHIEDFKDAEKLIDTMKAEDGI
ncbi:MAG: CatB-related O-acetyltransferase [Lachnospiraceae bacterium]|nr:CatB-related O-acetyltransferase [Lachnospiraceae bacterium]